MPDIIKIDPSEIPEISQRRPEYKAVRALEAGEAIKFPCTWNHNKYGACNGALGVRQINREKKWRLKPMCKDDWVYVHRLD